LTSSTQFLPLFATLLHRREVLNFLCVMPGSIVGLCRAVGKHDGVGVATAAPHEVSNSGGGTPARHQRLVCSDLDSIGQARDRFEPTASSTTLRTLLHPSFWQDTVTTAAHQHNIRATVIDDNAAADNGTEKYT
jgi:hypothetical protein